MKELALLLRPSFPILSNEATFQVEVSSGMGRMVLLMMSSSSCSPYNTQAPDTEEKGVDRTVAKL